MAVEVGGEAVEEVEATGMEAERGGTEEVEEEDREDTAPTLTRTEEEEEEEVVVEVEDHGTAPLLT